MDENLKKYIDEMRKQGNSDEHIREELIKSGWTEDLLSKEIGDMGKTTVAKDAKPSVPAEKKSSGAGFLSNKKIWVVAVVLALGLLATGAFGALYTKTWDPAWNPFAPSPADALSEALDSTASEARYVAVNGNLSYSMLKEDGDEIGGLMLDLDTLFDNSTAEEQKLKGNVAGELNYSGIRLDFDLDFLLDQKDEAMYDFYVRLNELPLLAMLDMYMPEGMGEIEGQWFFVPDVERDREESLDEYSESLKESDFEIERLSDEVISGVKSYHYRVVLSKEDFKDSDLYNFLEQFEDTPVDVWVGKKDMRIRKLLVETGASTDSVSNNNEARMLSMLYANMHNGSFGPDLEIPEGNVFEGTTTEARIEMFFDYPESLSEEISVPDGAKSVEEFFGSQETFEFESQETFEFEPHENFEFESL